MSAGAYRCGLLPRQLPTRLHAGSVTRAHDDLDIAVWLKDHNRIAALLAADGWSHAPEGPLIGQYAAVDGRPATQPCLARSSLLQVSAHAPTRYATPNRDACSKLTHLNPVKQRCRPTGR